MWTALRLSRALAVLAASVACAAGAAGGPPASSTRAAPAAAPGTSTLRIVGGLAGLKQFVKHEEPFWTRTLPRVSGGRWGAEIVPFDRAGLRGQDVLMLMKTGVVPFGTALLALSAGSEPVLLAPDLPGLNPDMASLRRTVAAFRPSLETLLRERHGIELLAVYAYPAQVVFCRQPIFGLASLAGRRIRTSSPSQSEWVEALGGEPVLTGFADIVANLKSGHLDCVITGTTSGQAIGLPTLTPHMHRLAVGWGLSVFGANRATWDALPADLRATLRRELPRLEQAVWADAERDSAPGAACPPPGCPADGRGLQEMPVTEADDRRRREVLARVIVPGWLARCGPSCAALWSGSIAPLAGLPVAAGPR